VVLLSVVFRFYWFVSLFVLVIPISKRPVISVQLVKVLKKGVAALCPNAFLVLVAIKGQNKRPCKRQGG
jgi:hypothetical protein